MIGVEGPQRRQAALGDVRAAGRRGERCEVRNQVLLGEPHLGAVGDRRVVDRVELVVPEALAREEIGRQDEGPGGRSRRIAADLEDDASREKLERRVIEDLIIRDNRFKTRVEDISEAVIGAKRMALSDEEPEKIADFIALKVSES